MGKELLTYFIRVDGSPTYSFLTALSWGVLNIALDYIFIGRMGMGILGAALATILGLFFSFSMGIYYFVRLKNTLQFTIQKLSIKSGFRCMGNGISEFVNQLAIAITTVVFNRTAMVFAGEDGIAAVSIIMYLQFLFLGVYFGYSMGIAPPLGYAYGDKKMDVCRVLEKYARRFFGVAPPVIYGLTFLLAPIMRFFFCRKKQQRIRAGSFRNADLRSRIFVFRDKYFRCNTYDGLWERSFFGSDHILTFFCFVITFFDFTSCGLRNQWDLACGAGCRMLTLIVSVVSLGFF